MKRIYRPQPFTPTWCDRPCRAKRQQHWWCAILGCSETECPATNHRTSFFVWSQVWTRRCMTGSLRPKDRCQLLPIYYSPFCTSQLSIALFSLLTERLGRRSLPAYARMPEYTISQNIIDSLFFWFMISRYDERNLTPLSHSQHWRTSLFSQSCKFWFNLFCSTCASEYFWLSVFKSASNFSSSSFKFFNVARCVSSSFSKYRKRSFFGLTSFSVSQYSLIALI